MSKKQITLKIILPIVLSIVLTMSLIISGIFIFKEIVWGGFDEQMANFSIITISDEDVATKSFGRKYKSTLRCSGTDSGVTDSFYERYDSTVCDHSIEKVTGITVVSATKIDNATLTLTITSKVGSGDAKIAIIRDDTVVEYIPINADVIREYDVSNETLFLVKAVCEDAKIDIKVEREITPK